MAPLRTAARSKEFLARRVLAQLDIPEPTSKQVATMRELLRGRGIVLTTHAVYRKPLSGMDEALLFWVVRGKTAAQIAKLLGITPVTAKTYLQKLKDKLNARTIAQAVYEAMRFHILWPETREDR